LNFLKTRPGSYWDGFFILNHYSKTHMLMKPGLKGIIVYCLCAILLQGCLLKHKVDRTVSNYYTKRNFNLQTYSNGQIKLNTDSILQFKAYSKSVYKSFFHVPLVFYYFSKDWIKCQVNPMILVNSVAKGLSSVYETDERAGALQGKEIELIFKKVPTVFYYKHRSHVAIIPLPFGTALFHRWPTTESYNVQDSIILEYAMRDKVTHSVIKHGEIRHQLTYVYMKKKEIKEKIEFLEFFYKHYDDELLTSANEIAKVLAEKLN
jgi:hypothetical protein